MRPPTTPARPAGPAGLTLLAATAIAGIILAVHGWSGRHSGLAPGALGVTTSPANATAGQASPTRTAAPASPGRTDRRAGSRSGASPAPAGSSQAAGPGPLLSAQAYASYSFRVWPGTPSAAARAALTGLTVRVHRQGSGITVAAGVTGQRAAAPRFYAHGARVYIVEASLGDDSGNSDYSLGDDGLVVTDAQGRILR
jgi:hypothetical protein